MGRAISSTMIASVSIAVLLMAIAFHAGGAQEAPASAPGPASVDCVTVLFGLSDCLTYVEAGSNLTKPDKPCCPELAELVKDNPICLCYLLSNTSSSYGIDVDINRALKLPGVCKVDTPPPSTCSVLGIPVSAPIASESPAYSPGSSELAPQGPSSTATNNNKSGASRTADAAMATLLGSLVIAFLPIFF